MPKVFSGFMTDMSDDQDVMQDGDHNVAIVDGIEGLRQKILMKLRFWRGEWPLAVQDGIPYYERIFGRTQNASIGASVITSAIRDEEEVRDVINIESSIDPATRHMTYSADVVSIHGQIPISVTV